MLTVGHLRRLWGSPTVLSMLVHGAAGIGFAAASLILARVLPEREYAVFTLVIALVNLGYALSPCGIDGVVLRRDMDLGPRLLAMVLAATMPVAVALAVIGTVGYGLSLSQATMVFLATAAGGAMMVAASRLQRQRRFGLSLTLGQSPNLVLAVAALLTVVLQGTRAALPLIVATAGFVAFAAVGWAVLLAERRPLTTPDGAFPWSEALAIMGLNASGLLLVQLDRLVIPHVRPLEELATFGVLAAIVGSLFRVLQMAVGFSLTPRLAAAAGVRERRRLIRNEARLVAVIVLLGSAGIWLLTPIVEQAVLAGKYHLGGSLVLAGIVAGIAKSLNAFSNATVTALADRRELSLVNTFGWVSVVVSVVAAVGLAPWGLAGVVYGVGLGWLIRALTGIGITLRHLHLPADPVDNQGAFT
jgi:O-antigen/teichoic acid export membrane protein